MAKQRSKYIGKWFHSWSRTGEIEWQGQVLERLDDGRYLVQLYEWVLGEESTQEVVYWQRMSKWSFYETNARMRRAYDRYARNAGTAPRVG